VERRLSGTTFGTIKGTPEWNEHQCAMPVDSLFHWMVPALGLSRTAGLLAVQAPLKSGYSFLISTYLQ
jgi:hypothetical protein